MTEGIKDNPTVVTQEDIIAAALRYCAVADWFESHPCAWQQHMSLGDAMDVFNRAEAELRHVAAAALRRRGHRDSLLHGFEIPEEAR